VSDGKTRGRSRSASGSSPHDAPDRASGAEERPPILGRWGNLYALVLFVLFAIILALIWMTRSFE